MPNCQELTELVTDYLEGRLSKPTQSQFESHMGECDTCEQYVRQMRLTVESLGRVPREEMPDDVRDAFTHAFRSWKNQS
jgi:anti-sigma factor RsiW